MYHNWVEIYDQISTQIFEKCTNQIISDYFWMIKAQEAIPKRTEVSRKNPIKSAKTYRETLSLSLLNFLL